MVLASWYAAFHETGHLVAGVSAGKFLVMVPDRLGRLNRVDSGHSSSRPSKPVGRVRRRQVAAALDRDHRHLPRVLEHLRIRAGPTRPRCLHRASLEPGQRCRSTLYLHVRRYHVEGDLRRAVEHDCGAGFQEGGIRLAESCRRVSHRSRSDLRARAVASAGPVPSRNPDGPRLSLERNVSWRLYNADLSIWRMPRRRSPSGETTTTITAAGRWRGGRRGPRWQRKLRPRASSRLRLLPPRGWSRN